MRETDAETVIGLSIILPNQVTSNNVVTVDA